MAGSSQVPENEVDLAEVNKYVGYCDTKCKVTFDEVRADLRLAQIKPSPSSNEVALTVVVMRVNRIGRTVTIDEMSGHRVLYEHELASVRLASDTGPGSSAAGDE